jgi:PAS domain S-box-containing protein
MGKNTKSQGSLRKNAENQLVNAPLMVASSSSVEDLLHELHVHQIELEMQNEELRLAHIALEESRDRYLNLFEFAPVGYLTLTPEGLIVEANLTAAKLLGVERSKLLNRRFATLVSIKDGDCWYLFLADAIKHDKQQNTELMLKRDDNSEFPVQLDCLRITSGDDKFMLRVTLTDFANRKIIGEELNLMHHAIDSSNNGIIITGLVDTDWAIIYANEAFLRITGYSMPELLGHNPRILQNNDREQTGIIELRTALHSYNKAYVILRNYRKDGSLFWNEVYISPLRDKQGRITHYVGVQNDVTQRVEMEAALSKSEAKMRSIFNNVSDGMFIIDEKGIIESVNPSVERLFGYPAEELIGQNINKLMPEPNRGRHDSYLTNYHSDGKAKIICSGRDVNGLRKDGSVFPMELGISEFNVEQRHFYLGTVHNITESKNAENALRELSGHLETAREDERTRIAREVHDDLGSVLTALKMDLSWLIKQLPADLMLCRQKAALMNLHIDDAIDAVRKIIADLRPSILDHLGLLVTFDWKIDEFMEQTGMQCTLKIPENEIVMDEGREIVVFRIMQEALTNIALHSRATLVTLDVETDENKLIMKISDNGYGMTKAQMHKAGKYGILGMHERARHFGGKVEIVSQPEKGTILVLNMPLTSLESDGCHD